MNANDIWRLTNKPIIFRHFVYSLDISVRVMHEMKIIQIILIQLVKPHAHMVLLLSCTLFGKILVYRSRTVLDKSKLSLRTPALAQLNPSLWWRHNVYLWRHNSARHHLRSRHYEYFILENFANQYHTAWGIAIVFPHVPLFKQFRNIFSCVCWFLCANIFTIPT